MLALRAVVGLGWLVLMWLTVRASIELGWAALGETFFGDFAHPWRAQFNTDFLSYLVLVAGWIVSRERRLTVGIPCAVASMMLGGVFLLAYVFITTFRSDGSFRTLVAGEGR